MKLLPIARKPRAAACQDSPCGSGSCLRGDQVPADTCALLPECCLQRVIPQQPALATRLLELGFRPGTKIRVGGTVAGGARVVTIGNAHYAVDHHTLRQLDVVITAA